jgi:hypothetical protein
MKISQRSSAKHRLLQASSLRAWVQIATLFSSSTSLSGFSINCDAAGPYRQAPPPAIIRSNPHPSHYYLELLIEAATSDSNGYAIGGDFAGLWRPLILPMEVSFPFRHISSRRHSSNGDRSQSVWRFWLAKTSRTKLWNESR